MTTLLQKRLFGFSVVLLGFELLVGCGDKKPVEDLKGEVKVISMVNSVGGLPGPVYVSQAGSPIHWQPWTKASFKMANDSRRLVLAVIAMPQRSTFVNILADLYADAAMVNLINATYVPILIDGDAIREFKQFTALLCAEMKLGPQFPLIVWMTAEGNPIAWKPLPYENKSSAAEVFMKSHDTVAKMFANDPDYVFNNSRLDQAERRKRIMLRLNEVETSKEPTADALRSLRQLNSLYDPVSRNFYGLGGLFPVGVLDVLSMSARMEGLPDEQRAMSLKVVSSLLEDILVSPMFDPLDGSVYDAKRGSSWLFPVYDSQNCSSQARVVISLLNAYEATGDKRALDRALGVLRFVEENHKLESGLFRFGITYSGDVGKWLWLYEEVKDILSPEELPVWVAATGKKKIGNIPSELDPQRKYFRGNSIAFAKSPEEVAELLDIDSTKVKGLLESARKKLLKVRNERLKMPAADKDENAVATFRMISAYAAVYRITGQSSYRDLAVETLVKAKEIFTAGPRLIAYPGEGPDSLLAARAFTYGVAINAVLDVEAVTLKGDWLQWAGDLFSTVSEEFSTQTYIKECPSAADLTDLPITDSFLLFEESTFGLLAISESRLDALGIPIVPELKEKLKAFPISAITSPVIHSDVLQAALMRNFSVSYVFGDDAPETLIEALARSPLHGVNRRVASPSDPPNLIPKPGEAIRLAHDGVVSPVRSASDVRIPSVP